MIIEVSNAFALALPALASAAFAFVAVKWL